MLTSRLKPYNSYRDSKQLWLGSIPTHWSLRRAKYILTENDDRAMSDTGVLLSVSQYSGVTKRRSYNGSNEPDTRAASLVGYKIAKADYLVVNIMLAWNGSLGVSSFDGVVSPAYCVYRFRTGRPWYYHHLLRSTAYRAEIKRRSRGVVESRLRLYSEDLLGMPLLEPTIAEQDAVVRFLNAVDRKVNRFIRNKRRLIDLLNEQKQATIIQHVTRGLDSSVELKPTGIRWMSMIPKHWSVGRLKQLCRLESGHTPSRKVPEYWTDCTIPWFTLADVHQLRGDNIERVFETKEMVSELGLANSSARILPKGTVFLSRTASVGFSGIMNCEMATSQDFACWIPGSSITSEFLLYVLRGMRDELRRLMYGSTHSTIYMPDIHKLSTPVPPISEQVAIVARIRQDVAAVHQLLIKAQREIELIHEYRTRLLSDVVTGKMDVRQLATADGETAAIALEPIDGDSETGPLDEVADEMLEGVGLDE